MAEVKHFNTSNRMKPLDIDWSMLLPPARKSKGRVGVVQQPEMKAEDLEIRKKTDDELEEAIARLNKNLMTIGNNLPDQGENLKATLERYAAEVQRRKRSRVDKDEREEEEEKDAKRKRSRGGPEMEEEDIEYQMKTDAELEATIPRIKNTIKTLGRKLPDKGEKYRATLRRCIAEIERRKRSCVNKDEREEEEEKDAKRMRRLRDEPETEKKQTNKLEGKLMDAETKIVQLKAEIYDLQEKLRDSSVQLDIVEKEKKELAKRLEIAERNCASVADDGKWLLQEGLPFVVQKVVNELISKENFMTSELRTLHQNFMPGSS